MMFRILFITGTLEAGKCGVADYVLLLANELSSRGFACTCVGLSDTYLVSKHVPFETSATDEGSCLLRLSSKLSWVERSNYLKRKVDSFKPDWISLQYVPYSFHKKGFPFRLAQCLRSSNETSDWHIMAHELWVDPRLRLRNKIISTIQRSITLSLFGQLKPRVIHTSNHWYQQVLSKNNVQSRILPLFSNIKYCPAMNELKAEPRAEWTFVVFGSISSDWNPNPLFEAIEIARQHHQIISCHFISIGRAGEYGISLWESLARSCPHPFRFSLHGQLPAELISQHLQSADYGIAVAPSHLIEKSGSVAAMLSHGLPVIISRLSQDCDQWHHYLKSSGYYILLDSTFLESIGSVSKYPCRNLLGDTSSQLIADLEVGL
jgi:glycosyltransferase involved in cell wall biosynthesis